MNAGVRQQDTASAGPESVEQIDPVGIAAQSDQEPVFPFERQQESRGDDADDNLNIRLAWVRFYLRIFRFYRLPLLYQLINIL